MKKTLSLIAVTVILMSVLVPFASAYSCEDFDFNPPEGFVELKQEAGNSYAWQNAESGNSISIVVQENTGHFDNTKLDEDELKSFSSNYEEQYKSTYESLRNKGYTADFSVSECSVKAFGENNALYLQSVLKLTAEGKTQKKTQYACNFYCENKTYTLTYLVAGTKEQAAQDFEAMASGLVLKDAAYIPDESYAGIIVIVVFSCAAVGVITGAVAVYINKKKKLEQEKEERELKKVKASAGKKKSKKH